MDSWHNRSDIYSIRHSAWHRGGGGMHCRQFSGRLKSFVGCARFMTAYSRVFPVPLVNGWIGRNTIYCVQRKRKGDEADETLFCGNCLGRKKTVLLYTG